MLTLKQNNLNFLYSLNNSDFFYLFGEYLIFSLSKCLFSKNFLYASLKEINFSEVRSSSNSPEEVEPIQTVQT